MDIKTARISRDRVSGRRRRHALALQSGTRKHREIYLSRTPAQQAEKASVFLAALPNLDVDAGLLPHSISVWYDITHYTLHTLEHALVTQGFVLNNALYYRLLRILVRYSESTQLRNLRQPERLIKKYNETYSKAWERHPHGDHDDTPPELRQEH